MMKKNFLLACSFLMLSLYTQAQKHEFTDITVLEPHTLYLGAVLDKNSLNTGKYKYPKVSLDEVFAGTLNANPFLEKTIKPSHQNMMGMIEELLNKGELTQNESFSYDFKKIDLNTKFYNAYFGQEIDLARYFAMSNTFQKQKKNAFILNIKLSMISFYTEIPADGQYKFKYNPAEVPNIDDLIYVNTVTFGKRATALIESDYDEVTTRKIINTLLAERKLTDLQKIQLDHIAFKFMTLSGTRNPPIKNLKDVISYMQAPNTTDNIIPISFTATYMKGGGTQSFVNEVDIN